MTRHGGAAPDPKFWDHRSVNSRNDRPAGVGGLDFGVEICTYTDLLVVVFASVKSIANVSRSKFACRTSDRALTASYLASGTPYLP